MKYIKVRVDEDIIDFVNKFSDNHSISNQEVIRRLLVTGINHSIDERDLTDNSIVYEREVLKNLEVIVNYLARADKAEYGDIDKEYLAKTRKHYTSKIANLNIIKELK